MTNEVTIHDLLELEAYADGLKEKAKALRLKLEEQQVVNKDEGVSFGEGFKAQLRAYRLKATLTGKTGNSEQQKYI